VCPLLDRSAGSWDRGIVGRRCLVGPRIYLRSTCLRRPLYLSMPPPVLCLTPTSLNLKTRLLPLPVAALRLRLSIPGVRRIWPYFHRPASTGVWWLPGLLCGVGPRVGTPKPTSPLRRRRHYLATLRVLGPKKYADRLAAAPGPARANLGRFGRVSFKGSQSKDHSRGPRTLGLRFGCDPGSAAKVHSNEPLPTCG
jgi:hypothetical protein